MRKLFQQTKSRRGAAGNEHGREEGVEVMLRRRFYFPNGCRLTLRTSLVGIDGEAVQMLRTDSQGGLDSPT